VAHFKYLETTVIDQGLIQGEIKKTLNSGNACYHSVLNLLSFPLLSKRVKIRIYTAIILSVVLYERETWSLTIREEHRLKRIFGPKRNEVTGEWRKLHNEELHNLYCSCSTIRIIKLRGILWARHVALMV
jgi:hypothetical protein